MHDFLVWLITCSKKADIKQFRSSRISTLNMIKAGKFFITPLQGFQRFPCRALTVQRHQFHKFYENLIIKNHVGYVLTTQFWSTDTPYLIGDLHDHCGVLADLTYTFAFVLTIFIIIRVGLDIWPFSISYRILDIETIRIFGWFLMPYIERWPDNRH